MQTCFRNLKKKENHLRHLFVPQNPTFHSFLPDLAHKKLYSVRGVDLWGNVSSAISVFVCQFPKKPCRISVFVPNQDKAAVEHRFLLCKCTSMCFFSSFFVWNIDFFLTMQTWTALHFPGKVPRCTSSKSAVCFLSRNRDLLCVFPYSSCIHHYFQGITGTANCVRSAMYLKLCAIPRGVFASTVPLCRVCWAVTNNVAGDVASRSASIVDDVASRQANVVAPMWPLTTPMSPPVASCDVFEVRWEQCFACARGCAVQDSVIRREEWKNTRNFCSLDIQVCEILSAPPLSPSNASRPLDNASKMEMSGCYFLFVFLLPCDGWHRHWWLTRYTVTPHALTRVMILLSSFPGILFSWC